MIRKVPLKELVSILVNIYEEGFDFIDIIGGREGDVDIITVSVNSAYLAEDYNENDNDSEEEDISITPINKINLDDLSV